MADYATKRVPLKPDDEELNSSEKSLQELRHLIIAPEQEDLARLHKRIENPDLRTQDVSEVLPEAMRLRREQGGEQALGEALAPSVEAALRESVRKDPATLADALFPVMGPAIRRSILQTLRSLFDSFNRTMEQSLSLRGLKWRLEAVRTGRPFSEVVLMHSLVFRIEQLFLIHKKTGLPLAHAVAPAVAMQDPSLVSGMLTAIQDFVRDSFHAASGEGVEKLNVGELEVWVESGPYASIAAVIRGVPPPEVRLQLAETLEEIHAKFGAQMEGFEGDTGPFASVVDSLTRHLDVRYREKAVARPKPYMWVFASVLLLALAVWLSARWWQNRQWSHFVEVLRSEPGIVVTSFAWQNGRFVMQGLRDPLSNEPQSLLRQAGLDAGKAEFHWRGYYALDDPIMQKRATALLKPPEGATLEVRDAVLGADGEAPGAWIASLRAQAPLIAGIRRVDLSRLADADEAEFARAKASIEAVVLKFAVGSAEISTTNFELLRDLKSKIDELMGRSTILERPSAVELTGHSDSTGAEATNRPLSRSRADRVALQLMRQGLDRKLIIAKGVAAAEPLRNEETEEARQYNRSVTFRIVPRNTPPL